MFKNVKMPPKMLKIGRPKRADCTVIGLPAKKKQKKRFLPFSKVSPSDKDRFLLECFTTELLTNDAIEGKLLVKKQNMKTLHQIPESIREKDCVDIHRIEKYFDGNAWCTVLSLLEQKKNCKWVCLSCDKVIPRKSDSVMCDRCLMWCHLPCTTYKKMPKSKHWFCSSCLMKY